MKSIWSHINQKYQEIDHRLLIHKPWLWETKVHLAMVIGIALCLFSLIVSFFFSDQIVVREVYKGIHLNLPLPISISLISLIGFGYWLSKHLFLIGETENMAINNHVYRIQFLAYFTASLIFVLPTAISLIIGYSHYFMTYFGNDWLWAWVNTFEYAFFVILLTVTLIIANSIQLLKSIGPLKLISIVSVFAICIVLETFLWNMSPVLGAISIIAIVFVGANKLLSSEKQKQITPNQKAPLVELMVVLLIHVFAPIGSFTLAFIPAAIICAFLPEQLESINLVAWLIGIPFYVYKFLPQFHFYYLRSRQFPPIS